MKTWIALLIGLGATACFHGIDATKVKCTTSDHCPTNFVCSGGMCVSGTTSTDVRSSEAGPVTAIDAFGADAKSIAPDGSRSDAGSGSDADGAIAPFDLANDPDVPLTGSDGAGGAGTGGGGSSGGSSGGGGVSTTGGTVSTGGTVATGGVTSTGGISSTGGTACQPKPRDCTSGLDNDCNGTPDKQETSFCACPVGQVRPCKEHPGYDGTGICKAGNQTCSASADKTTSSWGPCGGDIGPGTEACDAAGLDENCNGQSNEGCDCVNGASIPCDCGPATTCTNGKKGTCSVAKVTMYLDADHDGYGDPARPAQVCPGASGYVSNADDCDDSASGGSFYPGVSICSTVTQRKTCNSGGGGTPSVQVCDQGCFGGACRTDGTIGLPGYVTCGTRRCNTSEGCFASDIDPTCGVAGDQSPRVQCDGPNDCGSGESCCVTNIRSGLQARCLSGVCAGIPNNEAQVCDPLANTCNCKSTAFNYGQLFYVCQ